MTPWCSTNITIKYVLSDDILEQFPFGWYFNSSKTIITVWIFQKTRTRDTTKNMAYSNFIFSSSVDYTLIILLALIYFDTYTTNR